VQKWEKNFKETRKQKIIMMKKKIHAKKKIQGKKVPGARRFPQNCAKLTKKSTGACLGMIHMFLVSVETQSCND
jgi:hypothetical protein